MLRDGGFEAQRSATLGTPWVAEGRAGVDRGSRFRRSGRNNAWARHDRGWNAVRQPVHLRGGVPYTLRAFVRTSANVRDGYLGFRDAAQRPVQEIRFDAQRDYTELRVPFRPARDGLFYVFVGFHAPNQDAWIQVDDVAVTYPCEDTPEGPEPQSSLSVRVLG